MKIAFVYDVAYPWHVGGAEAVTFEEARGLAKEHEVHFFTMKWPKMGEEFVHERIIYHARRGINQDRLYRHGRRSIMEAVFFSVGLLRMFRHDFDVVISNYFPILDAPFVYLYCKLKGAKYIMEVDEVWDRNYWESYLGQFLGSIASAYSSFAIKLADHYICISSATADKVAAEGIQRSRITTYCPVINDEELSRIKGGNPKMRVVFSGRFIREKRLDKWLDVIEKASDSVKGIEALVVGSGPEKEGIEAIVKRRKLGRIVKIVPFYERKEDFYRMLKESALLLNMSEREGLSIICMESVALGVPVVLPTYSPIPEEIKEMCVVRNERAVPSAVIEILKSHDRSRFVRNTKNLRGFSTSRIGEVYAAVFKKLGLQE